MKTKDILVKTVNSDEEASKLLNEGYTLASSHIVFNMHTFVIYHVLIYKPESVVGSTKVEDVKRSKYGK